jgi:hypothetical protein
VDAPVGGSFATVFDEWHDVVWPFVFVSRPVCPAAGSPTALTRNTALFHEFVPTVPVQGVVASLPQIDVDFVFAREGAWVCEQRELSAEIGDWRFALGLRTADGDVWPDDLQFAVSTDLPIPSLILSRVIRGSPIHRACGVYAPLVSLCDDETVEVGHFAVLPKLARLAKAYGMQYIHVHIEFAEGMLLDPVQADVEYERLDGGLAMPRVRAAKLRALKRLFQEEHAEPPFSQWLQTVLFRQLSRAYQRVLEQGIQLFLDFVLERGESPGSLEQKLITLSHFASGIRIVNASAAALQPVATAEVEALFEGRSEVISVVFERLGTVDGFAFISDPRIRTDAWVNDQLSGLESAVKQEIKRKTQDLIGMGLVPFTAVFRRIASEIPSTLMFDKESTMQFSPQMVWDEFRILATGVEPIPGVPSIVMPEFSPEMMSEFPIGLEENAILDIIKRRSACDSLAVTFHLYDFVASVLGRPREEPQAIQLFKGYCRFKLPIYIDYLMEDVGAQESIRNLMEEIGRNQ